jgi:hypothetical protein
MSLEQLIPVVPDGAPANGIQKMKSSGQVLSEYKDDNAQAIGALGSVDVAIDGVVFNKIVPSSASPVWDKTTSELTLVVDIAYDIELEFDITPSVNNSSALIEFYSGATIIAKETIALRRSGVSEPIVENFKLFAEASATAKIRVTSLDNAMTIDNKKIVAERKF